MKIENVSIDLKFSVMCDLNLYVLSVYLSIQENNYIYLIAFLFFFPVNNSKGSVCLERVGTGWITYTQGNIQPAAHAHRDWMELSFFPGVQVERGPVSMIL